MLNFIALSLKSDYLAAGESAQLLTQVSQVRATSGPRVDQPEPCVSVVCVGMGVRASRLS